jgi:hypothetical protein
MLVIHHFCDQEREAKSRIEDQETLCKQQEQGITKLQPGNMNLELGMKSREELIKEMANQLGLDGLSGDDDEGDAAGTIHEDVAKARNDAHEEEDPEMLIPEHEFHEALEVILPEEDLESPSEPLQPILFTQLMRDYDESPSRKISGI